jgi:hypothetical protein
MAQAQTNDADLEALNALAAEQDSGDEVDNDIDVEFEDDSGTDWLEADDKPAAKADDKPTAGGDDDDPEGDDDEHEQYSARVQKRIANLTRKQREAERREQAAIEYAKRVQAERDSLRQRTEVLDKGYVSQYEERVTAQLEAARRDYRQAREINDADAEAKALEAINRATYEQQRVQQAKRAQSQAPQYRDDPAPWTQTQQQTQPAAPEPDPKAQTWAQRNTWFGQDRVLTQTAMAVHQELVADEGFDPTSDDYYNELDKRMKRFLPEDKQARRPGPGQTVAGSQRSAPAGQRGKQQVKLTKDEVAMAHKLGISPRQYAMEMVKIEQREKRGE